MIKVNLLDSGTERSRSAAVVEEKVANPRMRFWLLGAAVFGLLGVGMLIDYVSAAASQSRAKAELERQQQIAAQMAAVNKEQAELEKKLKDINARIEAIKRLRASQQGPVALLSEINSRIPADPGFRLESIEQKGGDVTIEGNSPNEYAVTQFGRSLEFSNGLFLNVSLEAERKEMEVNMAEYDPKDGPFDPNYRPETFRFKVRCKSAPWAPPPAAPAAPANQVAQK